MGRNILRRKILRLAAAAFLLILASFGVLLYASENEQPEAQANDGELFSRPLRQNRETPPLRSFSVSAELKEPPKSLLLTPASLEQPLVQHYIRHYSSRSGLIWLSSVMERGGPYLAFIRKEIAERDLPEELVFLPVIESSYVSTALSRSGASGLWQFMKNSMGPFDMTVTDWVDERRDFWKSTQGALRKLEENYVFFNDWPLALAAYNAGLGEIRRTIQRSGQRDYWVLAERKLLKTETTHYVPKLIAVAHILSNHRQFGLEAKWPADPDWARVAVNRTVDLTILAKLAEVDRDELIWANRELLHNVTPPGQGYYLKVRARDAEKIIEAISRQDIPLVNQYFHTVHYGDTLFALALHYGTTVDQILASNPGVNARNLRIGTRLLIPALKETAPYRSEIAAGGNLNFGGTHLVKSGETLWSIALTYEISPEVLAEANNMGLNDILREGKTLKTPIK